MTGGSLGLRTGSYGSLQHLQNSVAFPVQASPVLVRKSSKTSLPGSRDKEKCLLRICKFAGRRKVGMLLLVVVSVVVFMSLSSLITKDDDAPSSVDPRYTRRIQNTRTNDSLSSGHPASPLMHEEQNNRNDNKSFFPTFEAINDENKSQPSLPVVMRNALPPQHPCEKFALPPPPADKKRTGPRPCPVCYLPVEQAVAFMPKVPSPSPVLRNLTYVHEDNSTRIEPFGGSEFGGYPSLKQRNDSFYIKESMNVHCGFVKGSKPGRHTGFDINDADLLEMEQCHGVVVASAIFGNYDIIQQPKNISEAAKENVCFYMFVDEETEAYMKNSSALDSRKKVGLWRIVVVHNLPYIDARRNGKVPKLLVHRIFPNARFSIWLDGKLELVKDPYQILERFLWRKNATFAISRHYRRFDVFDEAEANKAAGKYDNTSIDFQVDFYKGEGLTPYSEAKLPIASDVPEGCVIIREHIPITNLFTCLWFNEVDRFTSRDQISFSTVRDKVMSIVNWSIDMFLDCERRNFVVQAYHRDILEHRAPPISASVHPPPLVLTNEPPGKSSPEIVTNNTVMTSGIRVPAKRVRDRRCSRRHRKISVGSIDNNFI